MARKSSPSRSRKRLTLFRRSRRWLRRWVLWAVVTVPLIIATVVLIHGVFPPGKTLYMKQETHRLTAIKYAWVDLDDVAPVMARSVIAAEDADFCNHWGFDMRAIRKVVAEGGNGGASTISQQTVKNVYLWQGRSWSRKAMEAAITPMVEAIWTKRRIVEVYLNVAEFDEGVFGIDAASRHYFGVSPDTLTPIQAARLAAVLPSPKERSASDPTASLRKRAARILDGAATIRRDGRAACFED